MEQTAAAPARFATQSTDHRFFGTMSVVAAVVVLTGFGSTYAPKVLSGATALPAIVHVHAIVFTSWLALFIVQVMLVSRRRVDLHRRLGTAGVLLAAVMLALGTATALAVARLGHRGIPGVEFPDAEGFLLLNILAALAFFSLAFAGWWFRRTPQAHKRLMLLATVGGLAPPGIARLPGVSGHTPAIGAIAMAFLLAGPVYDLVTRKRLHPAYLWGLLPVIATLPPVTGPLSSSAAWHRLASWLMQ